MTRADKDGVLPKTSHGTKDGRTATWKKTGKRGAHGAWSPTVQLGTSHRMLSDTAK